MLSLPSAQNKAEMRKPVLRYLSLFSSSLLKEKWHVRFQRKMQQPCLCFLLLQPFFFLHRQKPKRKPGMLLFLHVDNLDHYDFCEVGSSWSHLFSEADVCWYGTRMIEMTMKKLQLCHTAIFEVVKPRIQGSCRVEVFLQSFVVFTVPTISLRKKKKKKKKWNFWMVLSRVRILETVSSKNTQTKPRLRLLWWSQGAWLRWMTPFFHHAEAWTFTERGRLLCFAVATFFRDKNRWKPETGDSVPKAMVLRCHHHRAPRVGGTSQGG